jgi:hypothetical protein
LAALHSQSHHAARFHSSGSGGGYALGGAAGAADSGAAALPAALAAAQGGSPAVPGGALRPLPFDAYGGIVGQGGQGGGGLSSGCGSPGYCSPSEDEEGGVEEASLAKRARLLLASMTAQQQQQHHHASSSGLPYAFVHHPHLAAAAAAAAATGDFSTLAGLFGAAGGQAPAFGYAPPPYFSAGFGGWPAHTSGVGLQSLHHPFGDSPPLYEGSLAAHAAVPAAQGTAQAAQTSSHKNLGRGGSRGSSRGGSRGGGGKSSRGGGRGRGGGLGVSAFEGAAPTADDLDAAAAAARPCHAEGCTKGAQVGSLQPCFTLAVCRSFSLPRNLALALLSSLRFITKVYCCYFM